MRNYNAACKVVHLNIFIKKISNITSCHFSGVKMPVRTQQRRPGTAPAAPEPAKQRAIRPSGLQRPSSTSASKAQPQPKVPQSQTIARLQQQLQQIKQQQQQQQEQQPTKPAVQSPPPQVKPQPQPIKTAQQPAAKPQPIKTAQQQQQQKTGEGSSSESRPKAARPTTLKAKPSTAVRPVASRTSPVVQKPPVPAALSPPAASVDTAADIWIARGDVCPQTLKVKGAARPGQG